MARISSKKPARKTAPTNGRRDGRARKCGTALAAYAHDVRTALTGILALSELLASSDFGERERQWALTIKSSAEHLVALSTSIIETAKADAGTLTLAAAAFEPRRLIDDLAELLSARAQTKGLSAEVTIADDLPQSSCRRRRAPAHSARKSHRQCGEVHGAGCRTPRCAPRGRGAPARPAHFRSDRQWHRTNARRDQASVPSLPAAQRRGGAALWRGGARACARQAPGETHGWRRYRHQQPWPRRHVPFFSCAAPCYRRTGGPRRAAPEGQTGAIAGDPLR